LVNAKRGLLAAAAVPSSTLPFSKGSFSEQDRHRVRTKAVQKADISNQSQA